MPLATLRQVELEAVSPQSARYVLRLLELREGFVIEKVSGSRDRRPRSQPLFRWTLQEADRDFEKILRSKTRPGRKRCYREVCFLPEGQMSLFP
jgi:hypothetical protein